MRHEAQTPRLEGCVRAAWQTQLAAARQTPGLLPVLLRHRAALLPRFAATYTTLCALPRRVRRALHRIGRASLASVALWLVLGQGSTDAATITVRGACTLVHAIRAANADTASGGCPAGSGVDTIVLPANSTHTLTQVDNSTYGPTGLPVISSPITIAGRGSRIQRASSAPEFRLLAVGSTGELTLQETTVSGGGPPFEFLERRHGGGVANYGGTLTLQHSTISRNSVFYANGGGVYNSGTLILQHSSISGNTAYGNSGGFLIPVSGGGIFNSGTITLQHSTIAGNTGSFGGGVVNYRGTVTVQYSTIAGNSAVGAETAEGFGSGVLNLYGGTLTIQHSTITGNAITFGFGGSGVENRGGTVTIQDSTITGNSVRYASGGGVESFGTLTLQHSTISGNSGSGVVTGGTSLIQHSTISGNSAAFGGGVSNFGTLTLQHSTITGNTASFGGGGLSNRFYGTLTLARTLVSGNTAPSGPEIQHDDSLGGTVHTTTNLFGVNGDAGVVGFSPGPSDVVPPPGVLLPDILQPTLAANGGPTRTHALVPGSPALDVVPATDPGCTGTDQRGVPRPQGVGCDIGAVEGGAPTVVNDLVTLVPLPATFQTSANTSGCPPGFAGTFRFTAQLTSQAPSPPLVALVVEVETLSNGNLVQNALGGPQGVGARVPVSLQGGFADGLLSANEVVEVPLVICLRQKTPFQFFVDVLGVEDD